MNLIIKILKYYFQIKKMSTISKNDIKMINKKDSKYYSTQNKIINNADIMFKKRGLIHQYINEGMEENEFLESLENIKDLLNEYESLNNIYASEEKNE